MGVVHPEMYKMCLQNSDSVMSQNRKHTISGGVVSLDMLLMLTSIPFCARATSFRAVKNPF